MRGWSRIHFFPLFARRRRQVYPRTRLRTTRNALVPNRLVEPSIRTGNLYVLEFPGSLVRVTPSGTVSEPNGAATCGRYATGQRTTLVSGLTNPTSIAVGPDNGLYVSNRGTGLSGQVIRFER